MIQSAIRDGRVSTHSIAPAQVIRGAGAWPQSLTAIQSLTRRPLLLGRSAATQSLRDELGRDLSGLGLGVITKHWIMTAVSRTYSVCNPR